MKTKTFEFETRSLAKGVPVARKLPAQSVKIVVKDSTVVSVYAISNNAMVSNAGYLYRKEWPTAKGSLAEVLAWVYKTFPESKSRLAL